LKRLAACVAAFGLITLGSAATASAGYWSWGHNYVGQYVNPQVYSGWNYWLDNYLHKHNGGTIFQGFDDDSAGLLSCGFQKVWGTAERYITKSNVGCTTSYIRNGILWGGLSEPDPYNDSYLFTDSTT
jgi:hypothetical protein